MYGSGEPSNLGNRLVSVSELSFNEALSRSSMEDGIQQGGGLCRIFSSQLEFLNERVFLRS